MKKPILLSVSLALLSTGSALAQTPTPFTAYAYIGKAGINTSTAPQQLFRTNSPSSPGGGFVGPGTPITFAAGSSPAQGLNAAGINIIDGLMYALEYNYTGPNASNTSLYRIGSNAIAEELGIVPGPTNVDAGRPAVQYSFVNLAAGTTDVNGAYWFSAYTLTDLNTPITASKLDFFLGKISNVSTLPVGTANLLNPTYYHIDISDTILQNGFTNYISSARALLLNGFPYTNASGGWQDMDINRSDRRFYSYISFPSTPTPQNMPYPKPPLNSHLVRIDTLIGNPNYWGKVTLINRTPNTNPNYEEDGAWFDLSNNFHVLFTNGQYADVNITNGTLGPLTLSILPRDATYGEMRGDLATFGAGPVLPLKLLSFEGKPLNDGTLLQWSLSDWRELAEVAVERSTDGETFTTLGTLKAGGSEQHYKDASSLPGTAYYRLQLRNINGSNSLSKVIRVAHTGLESAATAYPNPVADKLHINTANTLTRIIISDLAGRPVLSGQLESSSTISVASLPAGTYLLLATDAVTGEQLLSQTIQKL